MKAKIYEAKPVVENPLLDTISKEALIAWFRCNSCLTCKFREEVIDEHPKLDIDRCAEMHQRYGISGMVEVLGYSRE